MKFQFILLYIQSPMVFVLVALWDVGVSCSIYILDTSSENSF